MPDVPVPKEFGYRYTTMLNINGVAAPLGLDPEKVKILEAAFAKAAKEPEFIQWAQRAEMPLICLSAAEFSKMTGEIALEIEKYRKLL